MDLAKAYSPSGMVTIDACIQAAYAWQRTVPFVTSMSLNAVSNAKNQILRMAFLGKVTITIINLQIGVDDKTSLMGSQY